MTDPDTGEVETFVKEIDQFKFFWVLDSGHAVSGLGRPIRFYFTYVSWS